MKFLKKKPPEKEPSIWIGELLEASEQSKAWNGNEYVFKVGESTYFAESLFHGFCGKKIKVTIEEIND